MGQHYSDPKRASDPHALPDIEVFYVNAGTLETEDGEPRDAGWYWWSCFPGCMPDGEANGPFASSNEALADAQDYADDVP